mmetsp:Transcript_60657/g.124902  ORF Transcript_60657/g.124902 Transcript_60657/m.124902 type:complete len:162 (+) Transcript_60657:700-1185(+)
MLGSLRQQSRQIPGLGGGRVVVERKRRRIHRGDLEGGEVGDCCGDGYDGGDDNGDDDGDCEDGGDDGDDGDVEDDEDNGGDDGCDGDGDGDEGGGNGGDGDDGEGSGDDDDDRVDDGGDCGVTAMTVTSEPLAGLLFGDAQPGGGGTHDLGGKAPRRDQRR